MKRTIPALCGLAMIAALGCARSERTAEEPSAAEEGGKDEWSEAMGREHADDTPRANAATEGVSAAGVSADEVVYHDGVSGFLARPDEGEPRAAVVMIHEWWGLNDNIRTMAKVLAQEGYAVLAVDLYEGEVANTPEGAQALMQSANERSEALTANLDSALTYLEEEVEAESVGVIGWCFGGGYAFHTAEAFGDRIDAAVVYYGHVPAEADAVSGVSAPVLGIFAAEDQGIPVDRVRDWEAAMDEAGKDLELHIFPGVGHAFANPSGEAYDEDAAEKAWRLALEFLRSEL